MALTRIDLVLIVTYALVCIGIGIWSSWKQKEDDYLIAGRKLGTGAFIATIVASYIGGGALVAVSAYVYQYGISAVSVFLGTAVGFLCFIWYALRIRRIGKEKEFHTLADWFYYKYDHKVGLLAAIVIFISFFGWLMNQFIAGSSILSSMSGWSYETALFFSSLVILTYLFLGGFRSVVKTDIFQYLLMLILFFIIGKSMISSQILPPELLDWSRLGVSLTISFIVYGLFVVMLGADYWQRVYAAENEKVIRQGLIGSAIAVIITGFGLSLIGLAAGAYFPGIDPNTAAAYGLSHLLTQGMLGLGLILIFAVIMSSADTMIFVLATNISKDYFAHKYPHMTKKNLMDMTKLAVIIISLLSAFSAYFFRDIISVVLTIVGMQFALVPALVGSFHFKIKNSAAFASILVGFIYVLVLVFAGYLIPEAAIGSCIVSLAVLLLVQFFWKK